MQTASPKSQQERRSIAGRQKDAIFYDSGERRRMWRLVATICIALFALLCVMLAAFTLIAVLATTAMHTKTVGLIEHEDGRPTTYLGVLEPLHGDATLKLLQQNATRYVADLATVTAADEMVTLKSSVLTRTAGGSPAAASVEKIYADHFAIAKSGHKQPRNVDCRPDGGFVAADKPMRFDCYYLLVNADGPDAADPTKAPQVNMVARLELVQSRGNASSSVLITNPDEIYVDYIDVGEVQGL